MFDWTRRQFIKIGAATTGAAMLPDATTRLLATEVPAVQSSSAPVAAPANAAVPRERLLMDFGWRFQLGNADDPEKDFGYGSRSEFSKTNELFAPSRHDFDDSQWRLLDLPHDWAVELPFVEDPATVWAGSHPLGRRYPETSIGWYRRVFQLPASDAGKRISLEFDGIYRNAMVALNGDYLGRNLSGYAPFRYDITDFVNFGEPNVLVVRVDSTEQEGWFYEGAGIYRHVWLVKTAPLHIPQWGVQVTTAVRGTAAEVSVNSQIVNAHDQPAPCHVDTVILSPEGREVARQHTVLDAIDAYGETLCRQKLSIPGAQLWTLDKPMLYRALVTVSRDGSANDRYEQSFGIRTIRFDADKGFFLNGEPVKLKGTCNHQDHAGLGSALPDRIQYYRIEKLKDMGANAYRTSHNPPTPELLDACDRLGMLVMDETRMFSSSHEGLSQLSRLIRRDRNHPSVVLWSIGNEEPAQGTPRGANIARAMKRLARRLDPTRPITEAMNNSWGLGLSAVVDVQGFNYGNGAKIDAFHKKFPAQPSVGSEVASTVSTRGIYANDPELGYVSSYDLYAPPWATTAEDWWRTYDERPFLAGGFVWTGFDYRGEPTPYGWPCINSHFGLMDTCGFPKDNYYYYLAWWRSEPMLHLFPHWNWPEREGQAISVWCYSNLERVELFLNNRSLGAQDVPHNGHLEWQVTYEPGVLEARASKGGSVVLTQRRETTGAPARIVLSPDRPQILADGEDVSVVAARVVDAQGRVVPYAGNEITFHIVGGTGSYTASRHGGGGRISDAEQPAGPPLGVLSDFGKIIGVGNGDPSSHEPDKSNVRRAFNGLCAVFLQATKQPGEVQLLARSSGLDNAKVTITSQPATPRPAV